jgi:lysyl-tRNA synthetase class 2
MAEIPPYHTHEEFQNRSRKLREIRTAGVDPYPPHFPSTRAVQELILQYEKRNDIGHFEEAAAPEAPLVRIMGRLVLFRSMGKNAFAHLQDATGRIQILINRDLIRVTGDPSTETMSTHKWIEKNIDLGDWIGVEGSLFQTQKGELTLLVKQLTLLAKALLPLPDKHSGLADKGIRYKKRWLDLIVDPESLQRFRLRSRILTILRSLFQEALFEEVETPILQTIYGGAAARPFTTHLQAHHQDMFLRIALEISLKKLLVGGMPRIFEIGKVFRNEGIDKTHNPEFTMLEAYAAGWDYKDMMMFVETLFEKLALELLGTTKLRITLEQEGTSEVIDVKAPWRCLSMKEGIQIYAGHDVDLLHDQALRALLEKKTHLPPERYAKAPRGLLIAMLFEELVEPHLIQPHHIIDHPIETTPLCKPHRDPKLRQEGMVERFESFILGREMCNAYTELNDPELQRALLEEQASQREAGDVEASPMDEEFLEAICQGMPPAAGVGIGIDRLVMLYTSAESIRDVLFFPLSVSH